MKRQKTDNKSKRQNFLTIISLILICAIFTFVVFSLTILTFTALQHLFRHLGWITEKNFANFAIIETVILFILLGCLISLLMINYPLNLINKVIHAFDMISK